MQSNPLAPEPKEKRVHFFRLMPDQLTAATSGKHAVVDWEEKLETHLKLPVTERTLSLPHGGQIVCEAVATNQRQVIIGKLLSGDIGMHRGSLAGDFKVVAPDNDDEFFTRVNYVQFVDGANAFALLGGAGDTPNKSAVEVLANALHPLQRSARWIAQAITVKADLDRLKKASALRTVSYSGSLEPRDMLSTNEAHEDISAWLRTMPTALNADVRVQMKIWVTEPSSHRSAGRMLHRMLEAGLDQLRSSGSRRLEVQAMDEGDRELIRLLDYALTASVAVPVEDELSGVEFERRILASLDSVSREHQTRLIEVLEG